LIYKRLIYLCLLPAFFFAGANFIYSKHWPYHFLRQLGVGGIAQKINFDSVGLFKELFSDDLKARDRFSPDIVNRAALVEAVNAMATPRVDIRGIGSALRLIDSMSLRQLTQDKLTLSMVKYSLDGYIKEAYAYKLAASEKQTATCATLIIPGSGRDQALAIAHRDNRNYHYGVLDPYSDCDIYVLIKPNEDYLSIAHNGRKLTENAYINHLIGIGSSYSSRYVTDAVAIALELKKHYPQTIVTGLSQGGAAAVIVGIEARPDFAVIASGLFEISMDLGYGGFNSSLVFPGLHREIFKDWIPSKLRSTDVNFLIIGGELDSGLAGQDVREGWTCGKLAGMTQVNCLSHPGGHIYPSEAVKRFLADHRRSANNKTSQ
jgi:hypothetical protein